MAEPREQPPADVEQKGEPDLLSLGLLVYFVGLIVLVAALLALPALY
jgi:hypothetical protein